VSINTCLFADEIDSGEYTAPVEGSTPMQNRLYTRIKREQCSDVWYALDTMSPDAVHWKYLRDFWDKESKYGIGCKKRLWEFCFDKGNRQLMWEQMEGGELRDISNNHEHHHVGEEVANDGVCNTQEIPPCPSTTDSGDSLTQLERR
jgi:hypothetical protein